eukprot:Rhum_TRINITY_DN15378_c14_g1::Rhum_TRINITY_DN15378_c14_g1_i1::g.154389::m.154389
MLLFFWFSLYFFLGLFFLFSLCFAWLVAPKGDNTAHLPFPSPFVPSYNSTSLRQASMEAWDFFNLATDGRPFACEGFSCGFRFTVPAGAAGSSPPRPFTFSDAGTAGTSCFITISVGCFFMLFVGDFVSELSSSGSESEAAAAAAAAFAPFFFGVSSFLASAFFASFPFGFGFSFLLSSFSLSLSLSAPLLLSLPATARFGLPPFFALPVLLGVEVAGAGVEVDRGGGGLLPAPPVAAAPGEPEVAPHSFSSSSFFFFCSFSSSRGSSLSVEDPKQHPMVLAACVRVRRQGGRGPALTGRPCDVPMKYRYCS